MDEADAAGWTEILNLDITDGGPLPGDAGKACWWYNNFGQRKTINRAKQRYDITEWVEAYEKSKY